MTEVSSHSSSACRRKMPSAAVAPGRRQVEVATLGVGDQPVRHEPAEHLAGGLGGDPHVARDLGGRHAARVVGADEDAQGEKVLLGSGRQVALIVVSRHRGQDTGLVPDRNVRALRTTAMVRPASHARSRIRPSAARRESPSAALPVADRTSDATTAAASSVRAAIVAIDAAAGMASEEDEGEDLEDEEERCGQAVVAGGGKSAAAGHLAHHPAETSAIGSQPTSARARRQRRSAERLLVRART